MAGAGVALSGDLATLRSLFMKQGTVIHPGFRPHCLVGLGTAVGSALHIPDGILRNYDFMLKVRLRRGKWQGLSA